MFVQGTNNEAVRSHMPTPYRDMAINYWFRLCASNPEAFANLPFYPHCCLSLDLHKKRKACLWYHPE